MRRITFLLCLLVSSVIYGQRIVCWNVENLFDCHADSAKDDSEFLPEAERHWTPRRYWHKLDNIARTLAALAPADEWPVLVGLCEVENDSVLHDLTCRSPLRLARYAYVMTDSPDARGVDVALLYQPGQFLLLDTWNVRVPSVENGLRPTRDILCARGILQTGDTLCVIVTHFPSRAGGDKAGDRNRLLAARTLRKIIDELSEERVLVMGDFNAEPHDPVFDELMPPLISLMPQKRKELRKAVGTYVYKGQWGFLDHMLVSEELAPHIEPSAHVATLPFLLDEKGRPWRTYLGPVYKGGFSDHLPIWVDLSNK